MPRDLATSNKNSAPTFAITTQDLMERLAKNKAPSCAILVMQTLVAYSFGKTSCFPSHKTIQTWLGGKGSLALSTIRKALKWLEDHGFIKRNNCRSKDRYLLFIDQAPKPKDPSEQKRSQEIPPESSKEQPLPPKRSSRADQTSKNDHPRTSKNSDEESNRYERST